MVANKQQDTKNISIVVQEILEKEIIVKAKTRSEAEKIVKQQYKNSSIVLNNDNLTKTLFCINGIY